ncbi:alcohol dehydrogenase catalytic domain-containing protein [Acidisoma cellulosilytica]|uniref:Alcohol dehydrogenase catalytic domain-containing protein n=1 Tax=Acidisoma cellulosilyticum TaxID=2802395 RepID=A0A963Z6K9_9PROT|nr:alcohol dehydrogenase catalytic domain-containing protein [Acidisoma cellulosilyticum]MCB8883573.1 alcohol dehydrogenase catalytic domain-containing protein [Acidisoma cellulosilyticum]
MKALRFHKAQDLRLDEVAAPPAPTGQDVLVRISLCGICGSDLHEYQAGPIIVPTSPHPFTGAMAPLILGHELSALVEAVGPDVATIAVGDRVAAMPHLNKPGEYFARRNLGHISAETGIIGLSGPWGGFGEYALIPEQNLVRLPADVSDAQGAIVEPASVALHAIDRGGVFPGASVLITGAGPIGVLVALAARAAGATRIFLFEPNSQRAARVRGLPGISVFDRLGEDFVYAVKTGTAAGIGVDIAIECAGHRDALALCLDKVRRDGTIVQVGLFVKEPTFDMYKLCEKAVRLIGNWGNPITIGPRVVELIASGLYPVEMIISGQVPLAEAVTEGFDVLCRPGNDKLKILVAVGAA